jgi:hypothetical protein
MTESEGVALIRAGREIGGSMSSLFVARCAIVMTDSSCLISV